LPCIDSARIKEGVARLFFYFLKQNFERGIMPGNSYCLRKAFRGNVEHAD